MNFLWALCLALPQASWAEYRVFQLQIRTADNALVREVISTLDPDQYPGYYPLQTGESVSYFQTWMCRGRTSERAPCPNPNPSPADSANLNSSAGANPLDVEARNLPPEASQSAPTTP